MPPFPEKFFRTMYEYQLLVSCKHIKVAHINTSIQWVQYQTYTIEPFPHKITLLSPRAYPWFNIYGTHRISLQRLIFISSHIKPLGFLLQQNLTKKNLQTPNDKAFWIFFFWIQSHIRYHRVTNCCLCGDRCVRIFLYPLKILSFPGVITEHEQWQIS